MYLEVQLTYELILFKFQKKDNYVLIKTNSKLLEEYISSNKDFMKNILLLDQLSLYYVVYNGDKQCNIEATQNNKNWYFIVQSGNKNGIHYKPYCLIIFK